MKKKEESDIRKMSFTKLIEYFEDSCICFHEMGSITKIELDSIKQEILDRYSRACERKTI